MTKALTLALTVLVLTAVEATPIPRDRKPDFSHMSGLLGSWTCMVDSARRPRPFRQTVTTTISPDGYWMVSRTITDPVPWNPITIAATDYVTYDPTTARWVDISMDDYGAYDVSSSPGWNGDRLVWSELVYPKLHGLESSHTRILTITGRDKTVTDAPFIEVSGRRIDVKTTCVKR